jgi:TonB family protein
MSDDRSQAADGAPSAIGRYQITGTLGFGAMGAVYKAFDPLIKRPLAIKTIRLDIPRQSPQYRAFLERFYQEARISGTLSHPSIVTLFDIGEEDGVPFFAMEYVEGKTIASVLESGTRYKPEKVIGLVSQVASALDYAHSRGIVHRDIKPSNLIVHDEDRVKVTDFGIAKLADAEITHTGTLLGTPSYMSPEQAMGEKLDGRADIFSLGVCAFEMLSGQQPFPGANVTSILYKLVHVDPIEPADLEMNGLVPQKWREVFHKVLAKKPENRYATASAFVHDLEYCLGSWFTGLGEETVTIESPVVEEPTVAISPSPTPPPSPRPERGAGSEDAATLVLDPTQAAAAPSPGEEGADATVLLGSAGTGGGDDATVLLESTGAGGGDDTTVALPRAPETQLLEDLVEASPTVILPADSADPAKTHPPLATVTDLPAGPPVRRGLGPAVVLAAAAALVVALGLGGWALWKRVVTAPASKEAAAMDPSQSGVAPAAATGTLRVDAQPAAARVVVNGEEKGPVPLVLSDLPLGVYEVRIEAKGYDPQKRDVTLTGEAPAGDVKVSLARAAVAAEAMGTLAVESSPSGATVVVDGRRAGKTPLVAFALKAGTRKVRVSLDGHETWSDSVDVETGGVARLTVRLKASPRAASTAPPVTPEPVDTARVYQNVSSQVDSLARKVSGLSPSYPSRVAPRLRSGERVSVVVRFLVTTSGGVEDVEVVESAGPAIDQVVTDAVRGWRFQPATRRGTPVKVQVMFKQTFMGG